MIEVDATDPAFADPTKFVGPVYDDETAEALARQKGWAFKRDGDRMRRVVPSPAPRRIFEIRPIRWLLERGTVVICAGGGGIPTSWVAGQERTLGGVEAVIDKDLASELLAREVDADLFIMATDVDGVYASTSPGDSVTATSPVSWPGSSWLPTPLSPAWSQCRSAATPVTPSRGEVRHGSRSSPRSSCSS
jgi:carbamate kinase